MKFELVTPSSEYKWLRKQGQSVFVEVSLRDAGQMDNAAVEMAEWCKAHIGLSGWDVIMFTGDFWDVDCNEPEKLVPIDDDYDGPSHTLAVYITADEDAVQFKLTWCNND